MFPSEPLSPLKSHPAGEASQTSGGSVTSEGSSVGFRPVPKKRTFLSRRSSSQTESNGLGSDTQVGSAGVVPAPRRSLQRGSSGSSNQSYLKGQDETSQKSVVSNQVSQAAPPKSPDENSQQPLCDVSQVLSNSRPERERNPPSSVTRDRSVDGSSGDSHLKSLIKPSHPSTATRDPRNFRPTTCTRIDASADREVPRESDEREDQTQRERAAVNAVTLQTGSIQDSDGKNNSSVGTAERQEEPSLPQSTVGEFSNKLLGIWNQDKIR